LLSIKPFVPLVTSSSGRRMVRLRRSCRRERGWRTSTSPSWSTGWPSTSSRPTCARAPFSRRRC